ncbi:MAG: hypothetical protein M1821_001214 [Bathelium mastoideum]|nr:MAG: hypothetical protein M1821_001214 [Bathelium mastoideum]
MPDVHAVNGASKFPPYQKGYVGSLRTFQLPPVVQGDERDKTMGKEMIDAWRKEGIFQIHMTPEQGDILRQCYQVSKDFFQLPRNDKAKHVDDQSFAGYIASGEEITAGVADYSEVFTVTKDLPASDARVVDKWPGHGSCPWPNESYKVAMKELMALLGESGDKLLKLAALGLGLQDINELLRLTEDGWHHMRVLRFPQVHQSSGNGRIGRGIGSHTDYGFLVLASQDDIGGLFVRPRVEGEQEPKNWKSTAAGFNENDEKWMFVPPVENVLTVFPGDMLQFVTNDFLPSTIHKVALNESERFAFAYFHEPNFSTVLRPMPKFFDKIHYGSHFTNMFMRSYPERVTAKRIKDENRMYILQGLKSQSMAAF